MNAALDARGVHLPAGECDDVRMGGFMQGGGYGFTSRTFGMHSDNVTSFRMMLANGRTVTASPNVNSDLFWAVRGGTGGNFGVLLNAEYKIQKLDKVYGWSILWPLSTAAERKIASEAMMAIQKDFFRTAPAEFNIQIAVCYQPPKKGARVVPQLVVRGLYVGTEKAGKAAIAPIRKLKGAQFQYEAFEAFIKIDNMLLNYPYDIPYIPFEKKGQPPEDKQARNVARDLTLDEWQKILDHFVTSPNKWSYLYFEVYGGKINEYPLEDSAFIHRDCAFCTALDIFYYQGRRQEGRGQISEGLVQADGADVERPHLSELSEDRRARLSQALLGQGAGRADRRQEQIRSGHLLPLRADDLALSRPEAETGELAAEGGGCAQAADRL